MKGSPTGRDIELYQSIDDETLIMYDSNGSVAHLILC